MQTYFVTVKESIALSKNMQRLILCDSNIQGESEDLSLKLFPATTAGSYVKLLFDEQNNPLTTIPSGSSKPRRRTYTVKDIDRTAGEITIDFALHGAPRESSAHEAHSGPASHWAANAKPGEQIRFAGPGSSKPLAENYDWVLFAGDITALPSIESYLNGLAETTQGLAFIQVPHIDDFRPLKKPSGIELIWITEEQSLSDAIAQAKLPEGTPAVWAASEFSEMRAMRQLFNRDMNIPREQIYISSYWKKGRSEEQHKVDKRNDQEEEMKAS